MRFAVEEFWSRTIVTAPKKAVFSLIVPKLNIVKMECGLPRKDSRLDQD